MRTDRPSPPRPSRVRARLRAVLVSSLVTLTVLGAAEGAIRVLAPTRVSCHRILDFLWTRGMEEGYLLDEEEFRLGQGIQTGTQLRLPNHALSPQLRDVEAYHVGYDAMGLRNPGKAVGAAVGETGASYRLLCLGDSVTYGSGVEWGETYCAQLGARIEAAQPHLEVEIVNAGLPGYAAAHGYDLYRKRLQGLRFDLAVVAFGFNDHRLDTLREDVKDGETPRRRSSSRRLFRSSALAMMLGSLSEGAASGSRPAGPLNLEDGEGFIAIDPDAFGRTLREIEELLRGDGAKVVFLCTEPSLAYFPRFDEYVAAYRELEREGRRVVFARDVYARHPRRAQVKEWFDGQPNWTDELSSYGAEGEAKDRVLPYHELHADIVHPNRAGHQTLADALYGVAVEADWLAPRTRGEPWTLDGRVAAAMPVGDVGIVVTSSVDGLGWPWWVVYPFSPGPTRAPASAELARTTATRDGVYRVDGLEHAKVYVFAYAPADVYPPSARSWIGRAAVNPVGGALADGGSVDIVLRPMELVDFSKPRPRSSGPTDESAGVLIEVAADSGIVQRAQIHGPMDDLATALPSGCAFLDVDGDGDDDLFVPTVLADGLGGLWINAGAGQFVRGETVAGDHGLGHPMGVAAADYDGDGLADLLVGGTRRSLLLHNRGGGSFTVDDRLDTPADGFASQPVFVDLDGDADLDLLIARLTQTDAWGLPHPQSREASGDSGISATPHGYPRPTPLAYLQQESGFVLESGYLLPPRPASVLGLAAFPLRNRLTAIVAATPVVSRVWSCGPDGCAIGKVEGLSLFGESVGGLAPGDYDNDGDLDLLATYWRLESTRLFRQERGTEEGAVAFQDATLDAGLDQVPGSPGFFGAMFGDLDLDGRLDLVLAGGDSAPDTQRPGKRALAESRVLLGRPDGTFEDISRRVGAAWPEPVSGRGICSGDLEGDGDVDFAVVQNDGEVLLWRNDLRRAGRWLEVRLVGRSPATSAVGARVTVTAGGQTLHRWVTSGGGYLSQSSATLHFGLGAAVAVDRVEVTWPDTSETVLRDVPVDQVIEVRP